MNTIPPPPPPFSLQTTTPTTSYTPTPQLYNNNNNHGNAAYDVVPHHHHPSSTPTSSIIIVIIVISSAIILSATLYLLIRFLTRRYNHSFNINTSSLNDVVSNNITEPEHVRHHVISIPNNNNNNNINPLDSLPLFTFSSLTGKIAGADCAVCLSKFEREDQLRLLPLCCHAFHALCIDAWLKSNLTCPLCRSTVNPNEEDIINTLTSVTGGRTGGNRSNSFRIEIGTVSQRRDPASSGRRSYSVGSFEYVVDDGYEIPVESTHRSVVSDCSYGDKDSVAEAPGENVAAEVGGGGGGGGGGGSGRFNWLRDYVDRVSVSLRGSGRFFTGSSRRSEAVSDLEGGNVRIGEEISELFRWLSGV